MPPTNRHTAPRWESQARHGIVLATRIADRNGEAAGMAWFREHEQLPLHSASDCPMRMDGVPTPDDPPGDAVPAVDS